MEGKLVRKLEVIQHFKKYLPAFLLVLNLLVFSCFQQEHKEHYVLIKMVVKQIPNFKKVKVAEVNQNDVKKLNEPLRALAAYYSSLAGSNCDQKKCDLTTALDLGLQGSKEHKNLLEKWFPNDSIVRQVLNQECFQASTSSSSFRNYNDLIFEANRDSVKIIYDVIKYDHGKSSIIKGIDKALLKNNEIVILEQNLWKKTE